jgi:hypothetical protein
LADHSDTDPDSIALAPTHAKRYKLISDAVDVRVSQIKSDLSSRKFSLTDAEDQMISRLKREATNGTLTYNNDTPNNLYVEYGQSNDEEPMPLPTYTDASKMIYLVRRAGKHDSWVDGRFIIETEQGAKHAAACADSECPHKAYIAEIDARSKDPKVAGVGARAHDASLAPVLEGSERSVGNDRMGEGSRARSRCLRLLRMDRI